MKTALLIWHIATNTVIKRLQSHLASVIGLQMMTGFNIQSFFLHTAIPFGSAHPVPEVPQWKCFPKTVKETIFQCKISVERIVCYNWVLSVKTEQTKQLWMFVLVLWKRKTEDFYIPVQWNKWWNTQPSSVPLPHHSTTLVWK